MTIQPVTLRKYLERALHIALTQQLDVSEALDEATRQLNDEHVATPMPPSPVDEPSAPDIQRMVRILSTQRRAREAAQAHGRQQ